MTANLILMSLDCERKKNSMPLLACASVSCVGSVGMSEVNDPPAVALNVLKIALPTIVGSMSFPVNGVSGEW